MKAPESLEREKMRESGRDGVKRSERGGEEGGGEGERAAGVSRPQDVAES